MAGNTEKILIAEISDNTAWYKYFPYAQNVWLVQVDNDYSDFADADFELENIGLESDLNIISFQVNKITYVRVDTKAEIIATQSAFYYDNTTKTLLVHFENHKPYYYYDQNAIEIGFALGFYNSPSIDPREEDAGVWNNVQYEPRLTSSPVFKDSKDDLYYGKQKLQGASIEFINDDLKYKNFNIGAGVKRRNGNYVRSLMWTGEDANNADYDDFIVTYQGIIEKITEGRSIKIGLRDLRASLTIKSPGKYLDTTNYTDIKDPDKEYLIPEVWGNCYQVPLLCLNENVNDGGGSSAYEFLICDTADHTLATDSVQEVYINDKLSTITAPTVAFNTTQEFAYITIPAINFAFDDGSGTRYENMDKVAIDVEGYLKGDEFRESDGVLTTTPDDLIENGLAIIREIIRKNYGYQYNTVYYDLTTWESFEDNAYTVGYFIEKPITTQKQIEKLANSQLGTFKWNADRKFTFDNDDFEEFEMEIPKYKLLPEDYFPTFTEDSTETLASFRVGLKRKWNQKDELEYQWLLDDSNAATALSEYNSTFSKDFDTLIDNETDALDFASRVLEIGGISNDTFKINTTWDAHTLKAGEWVKVQADHSTERIVGWCKCQIQDVSPKVDNWTVDLTLRIFAYYPYITDEDGTLITDKTGRYITDKETT